MQSEDTISMSDIKWRLITTGSSRSPVDGIMSPVDVNHTTHYLC